MHHIKTLLILFSVFLSVNILAQNTTGINTSAPSLKAALHVKNDASFKQGVIVPDLTAADTSLISPAASDRGLFFYDYPNKQFLYFDGAKWRSLAGPIAGTTTPSSGFWSLTGNAGIDSLTNYIGSTNNAPLSLRSKGLSRLHVASNGNIGIGTVKPAYLLDVRGDVYAQPGILGSSPYRGTSWFSIQHSSLPLDDQSYGFLQSKSGYVSLNTPASSDLSSFIDFRVADNPKMTLIETGSLGIGTAKPGINPGAGKYLTLLAENGIASLEIQSTSESSLVSYIDFNNDVGGNITNGVRISGRQIGNGEGQLSFFTSYKNTLAEQLTIGETGKVTLSSLAGGGLVKADANGVLGIYPNSVVSPWAISGTDIYYNAGNVGIGNIAPTEMLEVNGNIQIPPSKEYQYSSAKTHVYAVGNADFNPYYTTTTATWVLTSNDPGQQLWRWAASTSTNTGTTVIATAPVNLPDGATIISIETVYGLGTNPQSMELRRLAFTGPTTFGLIASSAGGVGSSQVTITGLATSGSGDVVSNAAYRYWLKWSAPVTNPVTAPPANNSALYGVRIRYTVTKAD